MADQQMEKEVSHGPTYLTMIGILAILCSDMDAPYVYYSIISSFG